MVDDKKVILAERISVVADEYGQSDLRRNSGSRGKR